MKDLCDQLGLCAHNRAWWHVPAVLVCRRLHVFESRWLHDAKPLIRRHIQRRSDQRASFWRWWIIIRDLGEGNGTRFGSNKWTTGRVHRRRVIARTHRHINYWLECSNNLKSSMLSSLPVRLGRPRSICRILLSVFFCWIRFRYFQNDTRKDDRSFYSWKDNTAFIFCDQTRNEF